MAVHIRLQRHGSTHRPFYHVVAADQRKPRDGRFIEKLGYYDPNHKPSQIVLKSERIQEWYKKGAQPTTAVQSLLKAQKIELSRTGEISVGEVTEVPAKAKAKVKAAPAPEAPAKTEESAEDKAKDSAEEQAPASE